MTKLVHAEVLEHLIDGGECTDFEYDHAIRPTGTWRRLELPMLEHIVAMPEKFIVRRKIQKWEPQGGEWYVDECGEPSVARRADAARLHGSERATKEQAEDFAKAQRTFNRLHAYVAEHTEPGDGEYEWSVMANGKKWEIVSLWYPPIGTVLMPERVAKKLADDLNSGRVEL